MSPKLRGIAVVNLAACALLLAWLLRFEPAPPVGDGGPASEGDERRGMASAPSGPHVAHETEDAAGDESRGQRPERTTTRIEVSQRARPSGLGSAVAVRRAAASAETDGEPPETPAEEITAEEPEPTGGASGRLIDPDGYPIAGVAATLKFRDPATFTDITLAEAESDDEGRYAFETIERGIPVWIEFASGDYRAFATNPFYALRDGSHYEIPAIVLDPLGVIMGLVIDQAGYAVPEASVHVFDETHAFRHTSMPKTSGEGRFVVSGLPTGSYGIRVRLQSTNIGSLRRVDVREGLVRDDVVVRVTVRDPRPKDAQTLALYSAERMVTRGRERLGTLKDAQEWVRTVVGSTWFRWNFPLILSIEVKEGHGNNPAYANRYPRRGGEPIHGYVSLPKWAVRKLVVLHEVAHVCTPPSRQEHSPEYAGIFAALVEQFIDAETAAELWAAYAETGVEVVRFRPR